MSRLTAAAQSTLLLASLLLTSPAWAEDTILKLTETATVMAVPDQLDALMRVEAVGPTGQDAQKRVNDLMHDALDLVKTQKSVSVSTGTYTVWRNGPNAGDRTERWQAGQSLALSGKDGEALLKLVGDLQQKGLLQSSLSWRLSREAEGKARQEATKIAVSALRGRADEAASLLGLRFDSFREVRLDAVAPPVMPQHMNITRSMAAGAPPPPPNADAEEMPVTATAESEIVLKPK
jgi:predicted secreted protein